MHNMSDPLQLAKDTIEQIATPGTPWKNIEALSQGLKHYREHGR